MARSQQDVDWQSTKKTVLERSCHMFNNPFLSDVVFTCKGSDKKIFAHKYVLATSSAVFHAMFYGELAEKKSAIHLCDTDEESLTEFIRFLYTDKCNLTADNAVSVLYLAKKYIVPSLAQKSIEFLEVNLAAETAFTVLQQAIQFDEKKLEKKSWDLIDLKTSEAIASDAFTADINQATLEKLLKRESLNVNEVDLLKTVLKWSEAECSRKGIEANSKNKRAAMGDAIYQIRFASMTLQEFAQNTSDSGLLTSDEMVLFYEKFSGVERASEEWNMSERRAEEILLRCCRFGSYAKMRFTSLEHTDTISISFSKPVKFHGVRLLGCREMDYDVQLEVWSQIIKKKFHSQPDSRGISGFDVMLPMPIRVQANVPVHLKATINKTHFCPGLDGKKTVETNGITINFFTIPDVNSNLTNVERGQFEQIIFSHMARNL